MKLSGYKESGDTEQSTEHRLEPTMTLSRGKEGRSFLVAEVLYVASVTGQEVGDDDDGFVSLGICKLACKKERMEKLKGWSAAVAVLGTIPLIAVLSIMASTAAMVQGVLQKEMSTWLKSGVS